MFGRERIEYKTHDQVRSMRSAGLVVARALETVRDAVRPGMTTADLDALAAAVIADAGATPSFLGYEGYPASLCVSVNDEVVHGIPGPRELRPGDVVSVDCGAIVDGWHGDSAVSFVLGDGDPRDEALVEATRRAMWAGIAALATSERLCEVGIAIEESVRASGESDGVTYGIVEDYVGHGIGSAMHQPPDVPNYRTREKGPRLKPGMCLAIEPMVTLGDRFTEVCEDDWTVVTDDGARAAHWEHSVAILEDGIWVLTAADGGAAELAERGVRVAALSS
ncbi:type I methionyl aminopeptidase [Cellulosimicrobium composti]|uniref:Methionine aminopeptidase n=1 Tax=Cellulosimicrobium composti TaxID=2672572 RepID=A0A6N7ZFF3_9MICO|nr:type I methionyl aminopeptidase [Cellulosimicrobium composti]MTG88176.1 type I methionyl aminopeptidase [Cellulosimicrobium composti]NDO89968.1 type I methionyl aminopeptidase [Cellulosimicrobium composti]TWG78258.1 methionyl aminopeptidase [Cellulosimicrobium cellulans J34]SMF07132.1 methionine aminopeptidase, type I [Cellulosimicrobium cellulans J1]